MKLRMPKKFKLKYAVAALCILLLVILIIVLISSCDKKDDKYFFIKSGELYVGDGTKTTRKITSFLGADNVSEEYKDALLSHIFFSADKKYLYYADNSDITGDLCSYYFIDLTRKDSKAEKIDIRISEILPSTKASLLYLKDGSLVSFSPKSGAETLADGVKKFVATDSQDVVAYVGENDSLYVIDRTGKAELLDTEVGSVQLVTDRGVVYYVKNQVLYKTNKVKNSTPNKIKIRSGATNDPFVFDGRNESSFYFLTKNGIIVNASDYVSDRFSDSDKATLIQPVRPSEPGRASFPDGMSYNEAMAEYEKALQEYLLQLANYNGRKTRNEIRQQISNDKITLSTYQLYYYDGKKVTCLCENVRPETIKTSLSGKKIACISGQSADDSKVLADVSEFESYDALLTTVSERYVLQGTRKLNIFAGKKSVKTKADVSSIFGFSKDDKYLFISGPELTLVKINATNGRAKEVSDNAFESSDVLSLSGKTIHYALGENGRIGLYADKKQIDTDVLVNSAVLVGKKLYYITDSANGSDAGTLKCYSGGKAGVVAYDVTDFTVTEAGNAVYVVHSQLYLSSSGKPVAENISATLEYKK